MSNINVEFFPNIGIMKIQFSLHPLKHRVSNFFYSIYGNSGFTLKGAFDISSLRKKEHVPCLCFKTDINNTYFIKIKYLLNSQQEKEEFKIIELTKMKKKDNINMNILDKSVEDLFNSINLDLYDEDQDQSDHSNSRPSTYSPSPSPTFVNDESSPKLNLKEVVLENNVSNEA